MFIIFPLSKIGDSFGINTDLPIDPILIPCTVIPGIELGFIHKSVPYLFELRPPVPIPNFEKNQCIISGADNSDDDSTHKENLECLMCLIHWLIIQDIFCHSKVFTPNIDNISQNVIVNKCQVRKNI